MTVKNFKGPNATFPAIDKFVAKTQPDDWNNIPLPICETFKDIVGVFEAIKKFSHDVWNEAMTTQHMMNTVQAQCKQDFKVAREEAYENLITSETRFRKHLEDKADTIRKELGEAEERIMEQVRVQIEQKMAEETVLMKQWATHLVQEQVTTNSRQLSTRIDRQIKETKELFNVPGIIGTMAQDGSRPTYWSYEEFINGITRKVQSGEEITQSVENSLESMWKRNDELNKLIKDRVTEDKLEKAEKDLVLKMEEKIMEVQDEIRRDKIEAASKLAIFRSEVADRTFDGDTFNFLKNQVRFEWPTQMNKVNENDKRLQELISKHEEVNTLINRTITKIKQSEVLSLDSVMSEEEEPENEEEGECEEDGLKESRPLDETEGHSKEGKTPDSPTKPLSPTLSNSENSKDGKRKSSAKRKTETIDSKVQGTQRSTILQNLPKKDKHNM